MPVTDQVGPVENHKATATSSFHSELHSIWGPPPPAFKQVGEFLAGVGEGFGQAVNEGAKAAVQAVSNPGEAIHHAVSETSKTVTGVLSATEAAGEYIGDHAARGDMKGIVHDAQNTSHAIEHVLSAGIEHLSKMNAHDLGKVVGHDVLPGAIVAVAAPELAGEGIALAASAASKIGTVVREGAVIEKVAGVYESAASKVSAISEKMAGLNKKMEALQHEVRCTQKLDGEGFEHVRPLKTHDTSPVSEVFRRHVEECQKQIAPWLAEHLNKEGIQIHAVKKISDIFPGFDTTPACCVTNGADKGIYIAEQVWHNGGWTDHNPVDVLFNMFHESGHAVNATLRHDNFSNSPEFKKVFDPIWKNLDKTSGTAKLLDKLPSIDRVKDEVFADLWGHLHAIPHPDNEYSNTMKRIFAPIYEHMALWRTK
ncbi:MAG TPA: hypothetical protein V6C89_11155 [Drouetiella sp.]|jgi:hypothetical protein